MSSSSTAVMAAVWRAARRRVHAGCQYPGNTVRSSSRLTLPVTETLAGVYVGPRRPVISRSAASSAPENVAFASSAVVSRGVVRGNSASAVRGGGCFGLSHAAGVQSTYGWGPYTARHVQCYPGRDGPAPVARRPMGGGHGRHHADRHGAAAALVRALLLRGRHPERGLPPVVLLRSTAVGGSLAGPQPVGLAGWEQRGRGPARTVQPLADAPLGHRRARHRRGGVLDAGQGTGRPRGGAGRIPPGSQLPPGAVLRLRRRVDHRPRRGNAVPRLAVRGPRPACAGAPPLGVVGRSSGDDPGSQ